jgi:hypothetical protein
MTLFALVQNCHGGFEFRGVPAEGLFHNPRSFRSQLQHLGAPITRRCSANDESLFLQSIDRSNQLPDGSSQSRITRGQGATRMPVRDTNASEAPMNLFV